jgi:hypothetical protein
VFLFWIGLPASLEKLLQALIPEEADAPPRRSSACKSLGTMPLCAPTPDTALAGKPAFMPAPESYHSGIELHQQALAQVRYYDEMLDAGHDPIQVANRVLEDLPPSWMMAEGKRANTLAR